MVRYREVGPEGMKLRSAGRESNRAKVKKFRERVLQLARKKCSGEVGERFGLTLAAGHPGDDLVGGQGAAPLD